MTSSQEVITLNVGGVLYTTTRSTLTQFGESMLGAMFSGRYHVTSSDRDGNPFIDRDGPTFRHVLNFLRTGRLTLPGDFRDYDMLDVEADFFKIEALAKAVRSARVQSPASDVGSVHVTAQPGSMIEMFQVHNDVQVSGARSALLLLPLPEGAMSALMLNEHNYQTVVIDESSKIELFDYLQTAGWQMVTSSHATAYSPIIVQGYRDKCTTTHKYVWSRAKRCSP